MAKSGNKVKLQGNLENYLIIEDVFGLEGIQKSIIKKYLPLLNAYVKEALDIITGGKMSIKQFINDKMEIETIISGGSSDNFKMLSSGEKKIVRLAVGTGLALLSFVRSSQKPEIICLDEVFSSLDVNHVEGVFNLIEYLKEKFTRVLIISHSKDVNERIPCTITIEKNGGMYGLSKVVKIV
jgi:DNA repair exonuclease SbcCD ATPase subunit